MGKLDHKKTGFETLLSQTRYPFSILTIYTYFFIFCVFCSVFLLYLTVYTLYTPISPAPVYRRKKYSAGTVQANCRGVRPLRKHRNPSGRFHTGQPLFLFHRKKEMKQIWRKCGFILPTQENTTVRHVPS